VFSSIVLRRTIRFGQKLHAVSTAPEAADLFWQQLVHGAAMMLCLLPNTALASSGFDSTHITAGRLARLSLWRRQSRSAAVP
jgi:hypothetical protein